MSRFGGCNERLNYLREEVLGLTQGEVAEQLGMTQSNISSVEIGRVQPSLILVLSFAIACKISPSWLIFEDDDEEPDIGIPTISEGTLNYNPTIILRNSKQLAEKIIPLLSKRIKTARETNNLSQKKLAEIIGLAQSNISAIERGTSIPSLELLTNISEALNVHVDWLLAYSISFLNKLKLIFNPSDSSYLSSENPIRQLIEGQLKDISNRNEDNVKYAHIDGLMKNILGAMDGRGINSTTLRRFADFLIWLADVIDSETNEEDRLIAKHIHSYYARKSPFENKT